MNEKLNCIMLIDDDDLSNAFNTCILHQIDCTHQVKAKSSVDEAIEYISHTNYMTKKWTESPFPDLILTKHK